MRVFNSKAKWAILFLALAIPGFLGAEQWSAPAPIAALNSNSRDLSAFLTADGKTLYLASDRPYLNTAKIDLYISNLFLGEWTTPMVLPGPVNAAGYWDDQPSLTLDGRYMYFYSTRPGGLGQGDIWVSENINGQWQAPVNLGGNVNSSADDGTPAISTDGQTLIFASSRSGGYGAIDLYVSTKVNGVWQPAVNLGGVVNTSYNNDHPTLSYTGRWLFYSSHSDIVRAENVAGVWQTPVKLPSPVNTSGDDVVTFFLDCNNGIYMAAPGSGIWDIKTAQWLDAPGPNPCSALLIPKGQWRVRVTLLEASAALPSDVYIDQPISQRLIKNSLKNIGTVVSTPFISGEELVLHIHVHGEAMGLGEYDHYSNGEFAKVDRVDPLRYIVGFEDLPADQADYDYNDVVLLVELIGEEVNIWENINYLGESQVVQAAPVGQETTAGLDLVNGDATAVLATIPETGLTEPSYVILTEGDPVFYQDLLAFAPFNSAGTFLKVELTNGQTAMAGSDPIQLTLDVPGAIPTPVLPAAEDGGMKMLAGDSAAAGSTVQPRLYRFNTETLAWEEIPDQEIVGPDLLTANLPGAGFVALGYPKPAGEKLHLNLKINCGMAPASELRGQAWTGIALLLPLLIGGLFRYTRKGRARKQVK